VPGLTGRDLLPLNHGAPASLPDTLRPRSGRHARQLAQLDLIEETCWRTLAPVTEIQCENNVGQTSVHYAVNFFANQNVPGDTAETCLAAIGPPGPRSPHES
jgi:hypothetical protein